MNSFSSSNPKDSLKFWIDYLQHRHKTICLDINKIKLVAKRLQLLKPKEFVFIVSGTNGKGTTCRAIEILLIKAGYRVGVYSSPHILSYIERVRVQGKMLTEIEHIDSLKKIEKQRDNILLSYFEFSTLSALELFKHSNLDVILLEVGVGGRLDATNIIDADTAIITNIALDHTDLLGTDREKIGIEKAGIFREGKLAIVGEDDTSLNISMIAKQKKVKLLQINKNWSYYQKNDTWSLYNGFNLLENLPYPYIPVSNVAIALVALKAAGFKITNKNIYENLPNINLPGRFQTVGYSPHIILDVAHNPHSAHYLSNRLKNLHRKGKVHAVIGMLRDKDIKGTLMALTPQVDYWYCISLSPPRGAKAEQLTLYLKNAYSFPNIQMAWKTVIQNVTAYDIILVCGSFVTVSQIMKLLSINKIFDTNLNIKIN
ncbi:bifunctional tetrahydrofolate synthase/dihydrofolate synthase [Candidatus Pantoea edessiphila]|uniref:Dihydrofolate synthase/folylpolyglutamate synthase n=1 Tax=Candidatus Pantoea edessiphila TaxID=2044610 RepID=A0A2P5SWK8_9GAMM|nr:bifunctional tetrahydrofolate synthase/dihydrofolate synthase [Candidatus Pantoea edessiphila]PPI86712.1 bifunctional tetrahydrofolate synthase/dihydrofolate synthase [Candidatus Pantoea edessiphila]